jgi:alanyl-tRNA synthetase
MQYKSGNQIREDFLRFFESKTHRRVHSSSLVPQNDPTLLFTNAGMNQFKDVFLGAERREYSRAVSSQKCVRAGGKHNDLENVGFTRRHHTFFEMLGNFSFGDYFKREAIAYAWELLTSPQWFGIDPAKLYVTIFEGDAAVPRDDEAERLWIETGVPAERIFEMPGKDNFWQMGETGPCGPCSEIFYDLGIEASETGPGGEFIDKPFPHDDQRYVEIWNLVFMQFDRVIIPQAPGEDVIQLNPLPKPSIDTGMGLERIACVLQGVLSNYQTDLFTPLIARAAELTNFNLSSALQGRHSELREESPHLAAIEASSRPTIGSGETPAFAFDSALAVSDAKGFASLRIIADHARAATFLISDGVLPANEGRGYVLRKILRRGIRHGRLLGQEQPFMHEMVLAVRDEMEMAYPELAETSSRIAKVVLAEEEQFARVLEAGSRQLDQAIAKSFSPTDPAYYSRFQIREEHSLLLAQSVASKVAGRAVADIPAHEIWEAVREAVPGSYGPYFQRRFETDLVANPKSSLKGIDAFALYETFGLPKDFIADAARDAGLTFDDEGFEAAKEEEQQRARASWKGGSQKSASPAFRELPKTEFEGYTALRVDGARILALVKDGVGVPALAAGEAGEAVLDATSFYADSGGQVGDIGHFYSADHNTVVADVSGATKPVQGVFAHRIVARQPLAVGDVVDTVVDRENRLATERNHTGTHLLHAALREVLGPHVKQAGSLNDPTRLRFDFSHFAAIAEPELREIESIVNSQVLANTKVETLVDVPIDVAVNELGAMALFGEKYGDKVRVVKIGSFSTELCGGTHTGATGEIGLIKITGENSVSSGVRRVEALSGTGALSEFRRDFELSRTVAQLAGSGDPDALRHKLSAQEEELKKLRRELDQMRMKAASAAVSDAASSAVEVKGVKVLAQRVDSLDKAQMRELVDQLRGKLGSGVVVLGAASEGKVTLIVGVTKDLTGKLQAGKIVAHLASLVGGKGGGRPDLAEAGGSNPGALDATLASAAEFVGTLL